MSRRRFPAKTTFAFTLVEVLVSVAILSLLTVMITQLTNNASSTTLKNLKYLEAEGQARMVFDRMASDFFKMVKRSDTDIIFAKSPGNDGLFFYSEAPAYYENAEIARSAKNSVALIGYRINSKLQLERLGKGLTWDEPAGGTVPGSVVFLTFSSGSAGPDLASTIEGKWPSIGSFRGNYSNGTDPDYNVLSDQVFRLEVAFLLSDGKTSIIPITNPSGNQNNLTARTAPSSSSDSSAGYTPGSRWYDTAAGRGYRCMNASLGSAVWSLTGLQDVSAIIVAIAVLDIEGLKLKMDKSGIIAGLQDPTDADFSSLPMRFMAETWSKAVNSPTFEKVTGLPQASVAQIRIYQRTLYINSQ